MERSASVGNSSPLISTESFSSLHNNSSNTHCTSRLDAYAIESGQTDSNMHEKFYSSADMHVTLNDISLHTLFSQI